METLLQDVRYAARRLRKSPGFTVVAVLTLALGIGANSAIFSVVNGVLLRSLPFEEPDRLVRLYTGYPQDETLYPLSAPDFMSVHDGARSFTDAAAYTTPTQTLTGTGEPARVEVSQVSADFFEVMGVAPVLGRTFRQEENEPGRNTVAVLAHAFWRQRFGSDPAIVGTTLTLNGVQRTVVGVLPAGFDFPADRQVYYPLPYGSTFDAATAERRRSEYLGVVARLRPGVTMEQASAEVRAISGRLQREFPETNSESIDISTILLPEQLLGDMRGPLLILLAAVGLVLLIACANVANLLLARATSREGELAVRAALGAGRARLVRQLMTESVLLGVAGGAAGLLLAVWGTQALVRARPAGIPRLDEVGVDSTVVAFTAAVSLATGILFGLLPAVQVTRGDLAGSVRAGGRGSLGGRGANRVRRGLVVAEMALSVVLLVGAGLLVRSFLRLTAVDPGFRTERVVTFPLSLPSASYPGASQAREFYGRLLDRLEALPGVQVVAAATDAPLAGMSSILAFQVENDEPPPPGTVVDAAVARITPEYFPAMGIPLLRGRGLTGADRDGAPPVALVNEAFVRRYFPAEDPIGRRLTFDGESWVEIVGVAGDVPQYGLDQEVRPAVYWPFDQAPASDLTVVARAVGDPLALSDEIRGAVRELDPNLPLESFTTAEQLLTASVARPRFYMTLLTIFASVALALAAVGLFGVMSFLVGQRTRELGVRVALGAEPRDVVRMVLGGALGPAVLGVGVGIVAALLGTRALSGLLFGVGAADPLTYLVAPVVLLGVAALASYLPARRATRVDPVVALRAE